jgi:hypothetical protein
MGDIDSKIEERMCRFRERRESRDSPSICQYTVGLRNFEREEMIESTKDEKKMQETINGTLR